MNRVVDKDDRRKGIIAAIVLHILLILILLFTTFSIQIPPFPEDEVVMEMDFSGSESSGGAPQEVTEAVSNSNSEAEDVDTQEEESPVEVNQNTTNSSTTNSNTNSESQDETESQDPKFTLNNVFGNGGTGSGTGTTSGNGANGQGDGIEGPGTTGSSGAMSGRDLMYKPTINNPIQQEGDVRVQIWVDRSGKVIKTKVLTADPKTTSTSQAHFDAADAAAKKFKFAPAANGKDSEFGFIIINFTNN